jgi:integrase
MEARLHAGENDPVRRTAIPDLSGLTSYVLRHTYATDALTSGLPVPVVSALLGHKSMKMVDEHYNEVSTEQAWQKKPPMGDGSPERPCPPIVVSLSKDAARLPAGGLI